MNKHVDYIFFFFFFTVKAVRSRHGQWCRGSRRSGYKLLVKASSQPICFINSDISDDSIQFCEQNWTSGICTLAHNFCWLTSVKQDSKNEKNVRELT